MSDDGHDCDDAGCMPAHIAFEEHARSILARRPTRDDLQTLLFAWPIVAAADALRQRYIDNDSEWDNWGAEEEALVAAVDAWRAIRVPASE